MHLRAPVHVQFGNHGTRDIYLESSPWQQVVHNVMTRHKHAFASCIGSQVIRRHVTMLSQPTTTPTMTLSTTVRARIRYEMYTYIIAYRHRRGRGHTRGLWREDDVGENAVLVNDLLDHVSRGNLHGHGKRRSIIWYHPHCSRTCQWQKTSQSAMLLKRELQLLKFL